MRTPPLFALSVVVLAVGCLGENSGGSLPSSEAVGEASAEEPGEQLDVSEGEAGGGDAGGVGAGEVGEADAGAGEVAEGEGGPGEDEAGEGEAGEGEAGEGEAGEGEAGEGEAGEGEAGEGEAGEGEGGEGEGGEGEGEARQCARDEDCAQLDAGPICDPDDGVCVQCLRDAECPREHLCSDRSCVGGCRDDRDCGASRHCGPDDLGCVQCNEDAQCPDNNRCRAHECVFVCGNDQDCEGGVCDAPSGLCIDCRRDADCRLGTICADSACLPGCHDDRDCETGVCADNQCLECARDDDCPQQPGVLGVTICEDAHCRAGACLDDSHCGAPLLCLQQEAVCAPCADDAECGDGFACDDGACAQRCAQDDDCAADPGRPFCGGDGRCVTCEDGDCVCDGGGALCGDRCANLDEDRGNCGACRNHCLPNEGCLTGRCGFVDEHEPNNGPQQCHPIPSGPWIVKGVIDPNQDRDWWCFIAEAGQRVVFNVDARTLRSGLDSHLRLHELTRAGPQMLAENDDEREGQLQDSWLEFEFERPGRYAVEVGAWNDRGCGNCFYVLNIETE